MVDSENDKAREWKSRRSRKTMMTDLLLDGILSLRRRRLHHHRHHFPATDMAQMVCGSCRRLLKYLKGARYVRCSCCSTVNYVLEAHDVGQVKCGSCALLLMYPYGASSVRCSSCTSVTEIGVHNRRPPWSVQQGQAAPPTNFVQ